MRPILALSLVVVFAGCAALQTMMTSSVVIKAAARKATQIGAEAAKLSKEDANKINYNHNIVE